jgi:hypothetical protein
MRYARMLALTLFLSLIAGGCQSKETLSVPASETPLPSAGEATASGEVQSVPDEAFMMDLRMTLNLSFKIFHAMNEDDREFIRSVSAQTVKVYEDRTLEFEVTAGERIPFIRTVNFKNLEYWGAGYLSDRKKFEIVFARYEDEGHGTIYMDFIKNDNGDWLFTGMMTNA